MSTYESFGSHLDEDEGGMVDSGKDSQKAQPPGGLQLIKSWGRKVFLNRDFLRALILGQGLSLLICGTGIFSGLLQEEDFKFPVAQSFPLYFTLGITYTAHLAYREGERNIVNILWKDGWKYALLGIVDVEANFLVVKAYSYTSVTSVQILDCFSIATVLVLSRLVLGTRYKASHYGGVFVAVLGLAGLVAADVLTGNNVDDGGSNIALGDFLVVAGALLYGISNVTQEFVVKTFDRSEFLGMLGLFSSFVSGIQVILLERDGLSKIELSSYKIFLPWLGYIVVMYLIYTSMSYVMQKTSATVTNISVLSADFYSLIFGMIIFHYSFHVLYFVSFAVVIIGVAIYMFRPTQISLNPPLPVNHQSMENKMLR